MSKILLKPLCYMEDPYKHKVELLKEFKHLCLSFDADYIARFCSYCVFNETTQKLQFTESYFEANKDKKDDVETWDFAFVQQSHREERFMELVRELFMPATNQNIFFHCRLRIEMKNGGQVFRDYTISKKEDFSVESVLSETSGALQKLNQGIIF